MIITDEVLFKRTLSLERKRSERTGAGFLLVLVNGETGTVEKLAMPLAAAFRETDITGWYQFKSTIGLIFTALNGASRPSIQSAISARIARIVSGQPVELLFYFFPEEEHNGTGYAESQRLLYPDYQNRELSRRLFSGLKRATDIGGSLIALVVLSPLFLAIAAGIKMTSAGPVLFRQKRLGKAGTEFTFLKFRSMYVETDPHIHQQFIQDFIRGETPDTQRVYKIRNDPRVTPFGHFLRVTSFDELPQFINVLTGKMSLVGPRPPLRYEFECYKLWHRGRILGVKPGITGVWQVQGRSRTTFDEMVRMDLQYIRNRSFLYDLKILLKTLLVVISREGAY